MSKFKIGQKVKIDTYPISFPTGFGWIKSLPTYTEPDYRVWTEDKSHWFYLRSSSLSPVEEFPRPITFDEVEVGDTVRLTHDFGKGDTVVRTMTVDSIDGNWLESANENMLIARGISTSSNATLELLDRPEPKKVYGVGDEIVGAEIKNLPHQAVVRSTMQGTVRVFDKYGNSDKPGIVGASNRLYMENINDTGKFVIVYLPEEDGN